MRKWKQCRTQMLSETRSTHRDGANEKVEQPTLSAGRVEAKARYLNSFECCFNQRSAIRYSGQARSTSRQNRAE